jgi:hypothetical protein
VALFGFEVFGEPTRELIPQGRRRRALVRLDRDEETRAPLFETAMVGDEAVANRNCRRVAGHLRGDLDSILVPRRRRGPMKREFECTCPATAGSANGARPRV